jgi:hypothetical protein
VGDGDKPGFFAARRDSDETGKRPIELVGWNSPSWVVKPRFIQRTGALMDSAVCGGRILRTMGL